LDIKLGLGTDPIEKETANNYIWTGIPTNHLIIRQLPLSINKWISQLLSNKQAFGSSAPLYKQALHCSNYQNKLQYLVLHTLNAPKIKW
jgi:hypothetical protein